MSIGLITETVGATTFGFDFDNQYIEVDAGSDVLYVSDLWQAIKNAQWTTRGWEFGQIARGGGLDGLGEISGDQIESYLTVKLLEGWELKSLKTSGKFTVTGGNLIKENGLDPFVDNPLITHFLFLSQAGTVARVSVGSAVTPGDVTAIAAASRDAILTDGVAFPGARIDAAVSSRALSGEGLTTLERELLARLETLSTELHRLNGLDIAAPATITPTGLTAGTLALTYDNTPSTDTTIVTRTA